MKLDDLHTDEEVALELAPLIDVLFLIVLFYAVTTSFISPEDLTSLKNQLASMLSDRTALVAQVDDHKQRLGRQDQDLASAAARLTARNTELAERGRKLESLERQTSEQSGAAAIQARRIIVLEQDIAAKRGAIAEGEARAAEAERRASQELARTQAEHQTQVGTLDAELARLRQQMLALSEENERHRKLEQVEQRRLGGVIEAQQRLSTTLQSLIADKTLGVERVNDRLVLELSDKILFDSGSDEIKPEGRPVLANVGRILAQRVKDLQVNVGGHTDNVPLSGNRAFRSNWDLSAARAVKVVQFLQTSAGIEPERMSAVGFGEYHPIAANDSPEGRSRNRRIEIVLLAR
ncbi:chemotaxis protein MotB [uncultured Gammaproteobacteria bacterium]